MLALAAFVQLEVTLIAIAIGVSFRARSRAATFGVTAASAAATGFAGVCAWIIWFAAPWCVAPDTNLIACTAGLAGMNALAYAPEVAVPEWAWMLGVALLARFVAARTLARISG